MDGPAPAFESVCAEPKLCSRARGVSPQLVSLSAASSDQAGNKTLARMFYIYYTYLSNVKRQDGPAGYLLRRHPPSKGEMIR